MANFDLLVETLGRTAGPDPVAPTQSESKGAPVVPATTPAAPSIVARWTAAGALWIVSQVGAAEAGVVQAAAGGAGVVASAPGQTHAAGYEMTDEAALAELRELLSDEEAWRNSRNRAEKESARYFRETHGAE